MRRFLGAIALATLIASAGCASSRLSGDPADFDARQIAADLDAFQNRPTDATWEPLRAAILKSPGQAALESTAVDALIEQPVPTRVLDAAVVDLATTDWPGTMKWIRQYNVAAKTDASPRGRRVANASGRLAWLMLAVRANYAKDAVDATRMDLRDDAPFVGQAMNLANVDFSDSAMSGGTWHDTNLVGASFAGVSVEGALRCIACRFGEARYPGPLRLANGQWISLH